MASYSDHRVTAFPDRAVAVTPSDSAANNFPEPCTVYVGGAGDVVVLPWGSDAVVTFVGMPAGSVVPVRVKRVNSTSTTATDMVRVY